MQRSVCRFSAIDRGRSIFRIGDGRATRELFPLQWGEKPFVTGRHLMQGEASTTWWFDRRREASMSDFANLVAAMPFSAALGIEVLAATKDEVRARLAWASERCTTGGALHGGAMMALGDSCGALCAFLNLPPGALTTTIESKTNFFRGVRDGHVDATCRPLHVGRTIIVVQTDLCDAGGRRVAQITQTQAVLAG
jgi:uncharacterized protein (TIGR00369 family)